MALLVSLLMVWFFFFLHYGLWEFKYISALCELWELVQFTAPWKSLFAWPVEFHIMYARISIQPKTQGAFQADFWNSFSECLHFCILPCKFQFPRPLQTFFSPLILARLIGSAWSHLSILQTGKHFWVWIWSGFRRHLICFSF